MEQNANQNFIYRLTLLWAFVEGGLGGMLHLLHIPITGYVIGGFSIFVNLLLAKYSNRNPSIMLKALGMVLLSKFLLSPYSPLGAYIAVSFQSLMAIIIFCGIGINSVTILTYALIVMFENSIQKPIVGYLIYGKELVDGLRIMVSKFFGSQQKGDQSLYILLSVYVGIYLIWGLMVGFWANRFLKKISQYNPINHIVTPYQETSVNAKPRIPKYVGTMVIGISIALVALLHRQENIWAYLIKTASILIILTQVIPFFIKKVQKIYLQKYQSEINTIIEKIPFVKDRIYAAYQQSKTSSGLKRIAQFVFLTFCYVLYDDF